MLPKSREPAHPGEVLAKDFLKVLNISPGQFAESLGKGWNEGRVLEIIEGKTCISHKIAEEISAVLETSPEFWMHLQNIHSDWDKHFKKAS